MPKQVAAVKNGKLRNSMLGFRILRSDQGNALTELAIVLPILLAIFFAGYEFSAYLETWQISTALSREAANNIFRECAADRNDTSDEVTNRLTLCLQEEYAELTAETVGVAPNATLIVSIYRFDPKTSAISREGILGNSSSHPSRYSTSSFFDNRTSLGKALRENRVLVIGESYLPSAGFGLFGFSSSLKGTVYASTIM